VIADKYIIRPALKVGFDFLGVNKNKLVFNDELENDLETGTAETNIRSSVFYLDVSAGLLAMTERYWFGFSLNHLNRPDQSLIEGGITSPLPVKTSIHGGAKFPLSALGGARAIERNFSIVAHYKAQKKYDQLDIGGYYTHSHTVMGIWYRGLPVKSNRQKAINADALTLMIGIKHEDSYSLGFSYDLTISRLSFTRSIGSFELSYIREWTHKKKQRRRQFIVPCAKF
jgi:type IX secretion system PorP/SprF family membrane protein